MEIHENTVGMKKAKNKNISGFMSQMQKEEIVMSSKWSLWQYAALLLKSSSVRHNGFHSSFS